MIQLIHFSDYESSTRLDQTIIITTSPKIIVISETKENYLSNNIKYYDIIVMIEKIQQLYVNNNCCINKLSMDIHGTELRRV